LSDAITLFNRAYEIHKKKINKIKEEMDKKRIKKLQRISINPNGMSTIMSPQPPGSAEGSSKPQVI